MVGAAGGKGDDGEDLCVFVCVCMVWGLLGGRVMVVETRVYVCVCARACVRACMRMCIFVPVVGSAGGRVEGGGDGQLAARARSRAHTHIQAQAHTPQRIPQPVLTASLYSTQTCSGLHADKSSAGLSASHMAAKCRTRTYMATRSESHLCMPPQGSCH